MGGKGGRGNTDTISVVTDSSGTHRIQNSLTEHADRLPGVELREPRNLCVCVNEECGHGESAGTHATLLTDTRRRVVSLTENTGRYFVDY